MTGFDAGEAVESLRYRFSTVNGYTGPAPEHADDDGYTTIPEYTDRHLQDFAAAISESLSAELEKAGAPNDEGDQLDPAVILKVLSPENMRKEDELMVDIVSKVCQQRPSAEELRGLPWRHRQAFFGWILGEIFLPKE